MAFREMGKDEQVEPGEKWVTVTHGMSGHFAVIMWISDEDKRLGPFPEPYDTGLGRYRDKDAAKIEALQIAQELELPYQL